MRRTISALFVRFENSPLASLTDGWVFQGMFNDKRTLARAVRAVEKDIEVTRHMNGMRTVALKVVDFNE